MGNQSLSFRVAFLLPLSFAAAAVTATATSPSFPLPNRKFKLPPPSASSSPRATTSDLLALLGPTQQASRVNPQVAQQLRTCFKFLVPFSPQSSQLAPGSLSLTTRRRLFGGVVSSTNPSREEENQLIWWPPAPVMELARLSVDSGADPGAIHRILDPTPINVPDVEGSNDAGCELTRTPYGRRFINKDLNSYLSDLFEMIAERGEAVGLNVSLSRYDLFHGHLFIAPDSGRLGILFHAKEYPSYDKERFPYDMGYCQKGSNVRYDDEDGMNLRNILWLAPLPGDDSADAWVAPGVLVVLDARPGGIVYRDLVPEYARFARTLYEDDFGEFVLDVNYLNVGTSRVPDYQIFLC